MNKKFFKKNISLIIFMSIALIAVIVLLVLVLIEHRSMKEYDTKKTDLLSKIEKIFKQKYAPVKVNATRIRKDVVEYKKQTVELQSKFGHPYAKALKAFANVLKVPLDEFKIKFSEFWEEQKGRATRDLIFRRYKVIKFAEDFPKHQSDWAAAMTAFIREAQKVTLEEIDQSNVDGIFLAAMGKGRRFSDSPQRCQAYMKRMRNKMMKYFLDKKVNYEEADFSFNDEQLPLTGDIPLIAKAWEIVSDLTKRIADAKVDPEKDKLELEEFTKRGLDGEKDGNYTSYRFTITVNADLQTIRRIIKNLYAAYDENRIYAVRDIRLTKIVDGAEIILEESERVEDEVEYQTGENPEGRFDIGMPDGMLPPTSDRRSQPGSRRIRRTSLRGIPAKETDKTTSLVKKAVSVKEEKKILTPKDPGYAQVIIGGNNICRAEIDVDYIIYNDSQNY
jgi:hypothetical protein